MRDRIQQKMKDCASEWVAMKRNQDLIKEQRGDGPLKGYNLSPLKPLPDFHDFFFDKFEAEFAVFDKHARRFVFHIIYTNLEHWESSGLCCWKKYRMSLTTEGEAVFTKPSEE